MENQTVCCVAAGVSLASGPIEDRKVNDIWRLNDLLNLCTTVIKTSYLGQKERRAVSSCTNGGLITTSLDMPGVHKCLQRSGVISV